MITQHDVTTMARRCIFGFDARMFDAQSPAQHIVKHSPLGYIFFRSAFDECATLEDVRALLERVKQAHPQHSLILGLDQEGGQVERLNSWVFPGLASPYALGQAYERGNTELPTQHYTLMAEGLKGIGFNLNFFPTLDVHQTPQNPIIGNRSFSESPEVVKALGKLTIEAQHQAGIQSVLKHYPGHGNGVVDSHLALPELVYSVDEEANFITLANQPVYGSLPWVMVAHGAYKTIQNKPSYPASCDATVIQRLRDSGFEGIIVTDDLDMRGVLDAFEGNQLQACIAALNAGVDVLLFREAGEKEVELLHQLARAVESGEVNATQHSASLKRIQAQADGLTKHQPPPLDTTTLFTKAKRLHQALVPYLLPDKIKVPAFNSIHLLLPQPELLPHYSMDDPWHPGFACHLEQAFQLPVATTHYTSETTYPIEAKPNCLTILLVWLPKIGEAMLAPLTNHTSRLVLNIGSPLGAIEYNNLYNIAGWRPLQQQALAEHLAAVVRNG